LSYLRLSLRTLEKHRCYETGLPYRTLGGRNVYAINDILAGAALGLHRSTSNPEFDHVRRTNPRPTFHPPYRALRYQQFLAVPPIVVELSTIVRA
jgi:hypothetical protein